MYSICKLLSLSLFTCLAHSKEVHLGDNCIQIFHLGRYIVGYTVGTFWHWEYNRITAKKDYCRRLIISSDIRSVFSFTATRKRSRKT